MARWDPDASGRLERAAIELFEQQGFAETTIPEIAARAGVTTRTFFRHFADKREVLFSGEQGLATVIADLIAGAPTELAALAIVEHALAAAAESEFEPRRDEMRRWRQIVESDDSLLERGLNKQRLVVAAAVEALEARGIGAPSAELAAGLAFVAFQSAATEWHADEKAVRPLTSYVGDAFIRMRQVAGAGE